MPGIHDYDDILSMTEEESNNTSDEYTSASQTSKLDIDDDTLDIFGTTAKTSNTSTSTDDVDDLLDIL